MLFPEACVTSHCTQSCMVTAWSEWGACSDVCGNGTQARNRSIEVYPAYGGDDCPLLEESRPCNEQPCPIDCEVGNWTEYGNCTAECDGGNQTRTRSILIPPQYGGLECPRINETRICGNISCDEFASWKLEDALALQACLEADQGLSLSLVERVDPSNQQTVAIAIVSVILAIAFVGLLGFQIWFEQDSKLQAAAWNLPTEQLHFNWRNVVMIASFVLWAFMLVAPLFHAGIPWLSFVGLKQALRTFSLLGLRNYESYMLFFALFISLIVAAGIVVIIDLNGPA